MANEQNFTLAVRNYTNQTFKLTAIHFQHGSATDKNDIKSNATTDPVLRCQGDTNASAGTEGTATYTSEDKSMSFSIGWDIPWGPSTSYLRITAQNGCTLTPNQYTGDAILRNVGTFALNGIKP